VIKDDRYPCGTSRELVVVMEIEFSNGEWSPEVNNLYEGLISRVSDLGNSGSSVWSKSL
jgi:hypothetical protein